MAVAALAALATLGTGLAAARPAKAVESVSATVYVNGQKVDSYYEDASGFHYEDGTEIVGSGKAGSGNTKQEVQVRSKTIRVKTGDVVKIVDWISNTDGHAGFYLDDATARKYQKNGSTDGMPSVFFDGESVTATRSSANFQAVASGGKHQSEHTIEMTVPQDVTDFQLGPSSDFAVSANVNSGRPFWAFSNMSNPEALAYGYGNTVGNHVLHFDSNGGSESIKSVSTAEQSGVGQYNGIWIDGTQVACMGDQFKPLGGQTFHVHAGSTIRFTFPYNFLANSTVFIKAIRSTGDAVNISGAAGIAPVNLASDYQSQFLETYHQQSSSASWEDDYIIPEPSHVIDTVGGRYTAIAFKMPSKATQIELDFAKNMSYSGWKTFNSWYFTVGSSVMENGYSISAANTSDASKAFANAISSVKIPTNSVNILTRSGYTFTNWNTKSDGTGTSYTPGDTFTFPTGVADSTLYAQWKPLVTDVPVTGTVTYKGAGTATPSPHMYKETVKSDKLPVDLPVVPTPVVDGYVADKASVPLTATAKNPNPAETVTYRKVGSIIATDPQGNPIKGGSTPYKNDPTDPTKVVETPVPSVPGYKPSKPAVTPPADPTQSTKVTYTPITRVQDLPSAGSTLAIAVPALLLATGVAGIVVLRRRRA